MRISLGGKKRKLQARPEAHVDRVWVGHAGYKDWLRLLLMDFDIDSILEHEAANAEDPSARAQQKTGRGGWRGVWRFLKC